MSKGKRNNASDTEALMYLFCIVFVIFAFVGGFWIVGNFLHWAITTDCLANCPKEHSIDLSDFTPTCLEYEEKRIDICLNNGEKKQTCKFLLQDTYNKCTGRDAESDFRLMKLADYSIFVDNYSQYCLRRVCVKGREVFAR